MTDYTELIQRLREWEIPTAVKAADALEAQAAQSAIDRKNIDRLAGIISEQAAEIEVLRADAERYRWLRDRPLGPLNDSDFTTGLCIDLWDEDGCGEQITGEDADAVIDAAMQAVTP